MRKIQFDTYLENLTLLWVMSDMLTKITRKYTEKNYHGQEILFCTWFKKIQGST